MENQRASTVKIKKLTQAYKDGLIYLANELIDPQEDSALRRAYKQLERGV